MSLVALLVLGGFVWAVKRNPNAYSLPISAGEQVAAEFNAFLEKASPMMEDYDQAFEEFNRLMNTPRVRWAESPTPTELAR